MRCTPLAHTALTYHSSYQLSQHSYTLLLLALMLQDAPKLKPQLTEVLERGIPFMLIVGEEEAKTGAVRVKDMVARTEEEVPLSEVVATLTAKGCRTVHNEAQLL
jgi:histidyl-tRNA synthetase